MHTPAKGRAPDASGVFSKTPFGQLLAYAFDKRLTGSFEIRAADEHSATIVVREGGVHKARTSGPATYLGQVLFELGALDADALNGSLMDLAKRAGLHGEILLRTRKITPLQLRDGLETQTARKAHHVFTFPAVTTFAFYKGDDLLAGYGGADYPVLDPFPLIWRGVREAPVWEHVQATLARVGDGFCGIIPGATLERFAFQDEARAAIDCLRARPMGISELSNLGVVSPNSARLLVYCLLLTKQIAFAESRRMSDPAMPQTYRSLGGTPAVSPDTMRSSGAMRAASPSPSQSGAMRAPSPSQSGVPPTPAPPSISNMPTAPSQPHIVSPSSGAMRIPQTLAGLQPSSSSMRAAPRQTLPGIPGEQIASALARGSAPGVGSVSRSAMEASHPVFGGRATDELDGATSKTLFQEAEISLARKDFDRAEALGRRAHALETEKGEYLALLAWIEAQRPENQGPAATQQRISMLDRAVSLDRECERAYFYRAQLYKRLDNLVAAQKDFRIVAKLNPNNIEASREVRLFDMRSRKGSGEFDFGRRTTPQPGSPSPAAGTKAADVKSGAAGFFEKLRKK